MPNRTQHSIWPVILIGLGILLIAAAGLLLFNLQAPATPVPGPNLLTEDPFAAVPRARVQDAKTALDNGTAVFVDVRGAAFYEQQHIPGALSIPLEELPARKDELDPADWIITYCT